MRAYLRQTLAPEAYPGAALLVEHYLACMAAHRPAPGDLTRIAVWLDPCDRLRQRTLGAAVTQAWYAREDGILWRIMNEALPTDELVFRTSLDRAITSFADQAREGPAWRSRFDSYLQAKTRIVRDASLDDAQKSIRVREPLLRAFPTEAERYRARSLEND